MSIFYFDIFLYFVQFIMCFIAAGFRSAWTSDSTLSVHTTDDLGLEFFKPGTRVLFNQKLSFRSFQTIPVWGAGIFTSTEFQGQLLQHFNCV